MQTSSIHEDSLVLSNKFGEMVLVMNRWIENLHNGKNVSAYFHRMGYKKIAIHGTSFLAQSLQCELQGTDISIQIIFDSNTLEKVKNCEVDVIVVTSLYYYYEIREALEEVTSCPVICIDDVVNRI